MEWKDLEKMTVPKLREEALIRSLTFGIQA